jgi:hypothetical protein
VSLGPVLAVVDLPCQGAAARHRAQGIEPLQGRLLGGGGTPAQVGDTGDGLAPRRRTHSHPLE